MVTVITNPVKRSKGLFVGKKEPEGRGRQAGIERVLGRESLKTVRLKVQMVHRTFYDYLKKWAAGGGSTVSRRVNFTNKRNKDTHTLSPLPRRRKYHLLSEQTTKFGPQTEGLLPVTVKGGRPPDSCSRIRRGPETLDVPGLRITLRTVD